MNDDNVRPMHTPAQQRSQQRLAFNVEQVRKVRAMLRKEAESTDGDDDQ